MTQQEAKHLMDKWDEVNKTQQHVKYTEAYRKVSDFYKSQQEWSLAILAACRHHLCYGYDKSYDPVKDVAYLKNTLKIAQEYDKTSLSLVYRFLGGHYIHHKNPQLAYDYLEKALETAKHFNGKKSLVYAKACSRMGDWHNYNGNYEEAMDFGRQYLNIFKEIKGSNHFETYNAYADMGVLYWNMNYFESAVIYFKKAIDILLNSGVKKSSKIALVYSNLGTAYTQMNDHKLSLIYYEKALSIQRPLLGENGWLMGCIYGNLGIAHHYMKEYEKAKFFHQKALTIFKKSEDFHGVTLTLLSIAGLHVSQENPKEATANLEELQKELAHIKGISTTHLEAQRSFAKIACLQGDMHQAEKFTQKALELFTQIKGLHPSSNFKTYLPLAQKYAELEQFGHAFDFLQKALKCFEPNFNPQDEYDTPFPSQDKIQFDWVQVLIHKANTFWLRFVRDKERKDVEATYHLSATIIDYLDHIRQGYQVESSKIFFLSQDFVSLAYQRMLSSSLTLHQIQVEQRFVESAFKAAEKNRANLLLEKLNHSAAKLSTGIPQLLLQKEKDLRRELSQLKNTIEKQKGKKEKDEYKISQLQGQYFDYEQKYQALIRQFEIDYLEYFQLKHQVETITIEQLQQKISSNTALVEYFTGEKYLYTFLITSNDVQVFQSEKLNDFEELIEAFKSSIDEIDKSEYTELAFELHQLLIAPLTQYRISNNEHQISNNQSLITNLKIIPTGILSTIPFEALLTHEVEGNAQYADLPYLLLQYDISYHYSATLWSQSAEQTPTHSPKKEQNKPSFIGFAPVYKSEQGQPLEEAITRGIYNEDTTRSIRIGEQTFSELIYSEEEVNTIESYFQNQNIPTQTFFHTQANTSNFLQNVGKHKYVLISAHGFYNEQQPDLTGIILSPTIADNSLIKDTEEVGTSERFGDVWSGTRQVLPNPRGGGEPSSIFYLSDAYNLELNADLVVLSCCETGVGKLAKGEGVMALNRGFFYAGAKNVIYTLFKVYDQASCQLTQYLFQHILEKKTYPLALKEAKHQLILQGKAPIHWAGYLLIGE